MRMLLDTHAFLWAIADDSRLSQQACKLIQDGDNDLLLSTASLWEIAIKIGTGKLSIGGPFDLFIPQQLALNRIEILEAGMAHYAVVSSLPLIHRDPFDRLIIAQAVAESLPVVSIDEKFDAYPVIRLW